MKRITRQLFRWPTPGTPTIRDIVRPGDIVESRFTACGSACVTGPYVVEEIIGPYHEVPYPLWLEMGYPESDALMNFTPELFTLRCLKPSESTSRNRENSFWLNNLIFHEGRIVSGFAEDDEEVFILKRSGEMVQRELFQ